MTYAEAMAGITRAMQISEQQLQNVVPFVTGRLLASIAVERTGTGWTVTLDEGNMSEDEWNKTYGFGTGPGEGPDGAPYAMTVDNRRMFWSAIFEIVKQNLQQELGGAIASSSESE
jgi:hypothetical protein